MNYAFKTINRIRLKFNITSLTHIHNQNKILKHSTKNFLTLNKLSPSSKFSNKENLNINSYNNSIYNINSPIRLALFNKFQKFTITILKKRRAKLANPHYKMKTKNATKKRFQIVGTNSNIGFKFHSPGHVHKNSKKSRSRLM